MKVKTCRICLSTGDNFKFLGNHIKEFIEEIFKTKGFTRDLNVHNYICFECKALLHKSYNFIQKALRAQQAMYTILEKQSINISSLQSIDRVQLGLCSTLSYCRVDIDYYIEENDNILDSTMGVNRFNFVDDSKVKDEIIAPDEYACYVEDKLTAEEKVIENDSKTNLINHVEIEIPQMKNVNIKILKKEKKLKSVLSHDKIVLGCRQRKKKYSDSEIKNEIESTIIVKNTKYEVCKPQHKRLKKLNVSKARNKRIKRPTERKLNYPRKCDHCTYTIEQANLHFKHYLFCHTSEDYPYLNEAKFVCQFCGTAMRTPQTLRRHELTHGEKNYKCDQCPMKFHHTERLRIHKIRKHGKQQVICDYCNKAFKQKQDLVVHIRTHTGEKPFKCQICGAGFAHRGNIGIHIRSAHNIDNLTPLKTFKIPNNFIVQPDVPM